MAVTSGFWQVEGRDASKRLNSARYRPSHLRITWTKMAIVPRLRSPAPEEQRENTDRFKKRLDRTTNCSSVVDAMRTGASSHDTLELLGRFLDWQACGLCTLLAFCLREAFEQSKAPLLFYTEELPS